MVSVNGLNWKKKRYVFETKLLIDLSQFFWSIPIFSFTFQTRY